MAKRKTVVNVAEQSEPLRIMIRMLYDVGPLLHGNEYLISISTAVGYIERGLAVKSDIYREREAAALASADDGARRAKLQRQIRREKNEENSRKLRERLIGGE